MKISEFVKEKLNTLGNEAGLNYSELITDTLEQYKEKLKNRQLTANRITSILRQKKFINDFVKVKGKDKQLYIIRNQQIIGGAYGESGSNGTETNQA